LHLIFLFACFHFDAAGVFCMLHIGIAIMKESRVGRGVERKNGIFRGVSLHPSVTERKILQFSSARPLTKPDTKEWIFKFLGLFRGILACDAHLLALIVIVLSYSV
jgi:hypothetical protein